MNRTLAALALSSLLAGCSKEGNPVVSLPTDPGTPSAMTVTVAADRSRLDAGSATPAQLTITAKSKEGVAAADGTQATVNTNLGNFGLDAGGKPLQLATVHLAGGSATLQFFAGNDTGTANVLAQVGTSVGSVNLTIAPAPILPEANFNFEVSGLDVLFSDASSGSPSSYSWDFGDGSSFDASRNPRHHYAAAKAYTVTLTVRNAAGESKKSKFVTVNNGPALTPDFKWEVNGLTAVFTDLTTGDPTVWLWEFGDGHTSSARNPAHDYTAPGTYTVSLTAINDFGSRGAVKHVVTLLAPPQAEFTSEVSGLTAIFSDASTGNPTAWTWDFGDCSENPICGDNRQNPSHTYAHAGSFAVTLLVSNAAGSTRKSHFVTLGGAPAAGFDATVRGPHVTFTDQSTNAPTRWTWDFGDCPGCALNTAQNPTHDYAVAGTYSVTLTATNAIGSNSTTKTVKVVAPVAAFTSNAIGREVAFTDFSSNYPEHWTWNFGDCATSPSTCTANDIQNPRHTYAAAGSYNVTLTVRNSLGTSTTSDFVTVP